MFYEWLNVINSGAKSLQLIKEIGNGSKQRVSGLELNNGENLQLNDDTRYCLKLNDDSIDNVGQLPPSIDVNCHIPEIGWDDIQDKVSYWESAVVCYVLGVNTPQHIIEGFFRRI